MRHQKDLLPEPGRGTAEQISAPQSVRLCPRDLLPYDFLLAQTKELPDGQAPGGQYVRRCPEGFCGRNLTPHASVARVPPYRCQMRIPMGVAKQQLFVRNGTLPPPSFPSWPLHPRTAKSIKLSLKHCSRHELIVYRV